MTPSVIRRLPALFLALSAACGGELPGHYFTVTLETAQDENGDLKDGCNDPPDAVRETYTYRLVQDGGSVQVFVTHDGQGGDELLATGTMDVCTLSYASSTWQSRRDEGVVRWAIVGEAEIPLGSGCPEAWTGVERIEVIESSDPNVPGGCSVEFDATGTYDGEVD